MNKLIRFIPLILFIVLGVVLYRGLFLNPSELPSALVGKPVPKFSLSTLENSQQIITEADLKGEVTLLNVWGTWCVYCQYEMPYLLDIAKSGQVKVIGINYKDVREDALAWLKKYGAPYQYSIFDEDGSLGLDFGVYGAPETFLIDDKGMIRKRFAGPIDPTIWQNEFKPLLAKIAAEHAKQK